MTDIVSRQLNFG